MKTILVRLSVLTLALSGFAASSVVSYSQRTATHVAPSHNTIPTPMCLPNDPTCCGMH